MLVMIFISKVQQRKYGPYQIVKKINNNAYVVDFPTWMRISKTFNVAEMNLRYPESNSRMSFSQVEGTDTSC